MHRTIRTITVLVTIASLLADSPSCRPEGGTPADRESKKPGLGPIGNHSVECDIFASQPYGVDGPKPDYRPGFYQFTSEAEGDVNCTGKASLIKMTVIYQHATNGVQGAVSGRDIICENMNRCRGNARYRRDRLNCNEVYNYDDYTHVTAWYKRDANAPEVRISKESRHKIGTSHNPTYPCRSTR